MAKNKAQIDKVSAGLNTVQNQLQHDKLVEGYKNLLLQVSMLLSCSLRGGASKWPTKRSAALRRMVADSLGLCWQQSSLVAAENYRSEKSRIASEAQF